MKSGNLATKLLLAAVVLAVLLYFGINMAASLVDPFTTTLAYNFTSDNAVTVSGYVVRQELPLEGGGELVYFSRDEGERVSRGGTVAQIYDNEQALADATLLRSLAEQLEQLGHARSLVTGAQSTQQLDDEVAQMLIRFHAGTSAGDLDAAADAGQELRSAVLKRSYAYSGTAELDAAISDLEQRIGNLSSSTNADTTRITAPEGGLFSGLVDGYETVLTPESLESMTPRDYRELEAKETSCVAKLIQGTSWYFVTLMRQADMQDLAEGDQVTLRFQTGLDRDLTMTVERISDEDSGQRLVVLSSEQYLNLTTLLRHQNAQIIFDSYSGIRVPRSAVRILWEDVLDENGNVVLKSDGTPQQKQITAVYTLWGTTARLKPVQILWQEAEYILVTPDAEYLNSFISDSTREGRRLRAGDEVITAAIDLYDGKVIQ